MSRAIAQLDTCIEVVTPENIAFRYRVAGPFRRFLAWILDTIVCGAFLFGAHIALITVFGAIGMIEVGVGIILVLGFVVIFFYGGVFEALWNGQTVGKRMVHLRVVTVDGLPISGWQAVLRNILRFIDMQPLACCLAGLVTASFSPRFQRLGDLAAGTMVILEERSWLEGVLRLDDPHVVRLAATLPAHFQPSRSLARALAVYVQRRANFSLGRRLEIARHLAAPLCEHLRISPDVHADLLLCALYHRIFVTESDDANHRGESPFSAAPEDAGLPEWLAALPSGAEGGA